MNVSVRKAFEISTVNADVRVFVDYKRRSLREIVRYMKLMGDNA